MSHKIKVQGKFNESGYCGYGVGRCDHCSGSVSSGSIHADSGVCNFDWIVYEVR